MLIRLSIKNYALIENLHVDFKQGLSIITGETGAGKSILLGALGLVLGNRADSTTLKNKEIKCVIEGEFKIGDYNLKSFFDKHDLDFDGNTIIRREILPSGKSRSFVNDTPVNLAVLQELSSFLIDVHSQHQTLKLSDHNFHFQLIDSLARNFDRIAAYNDGLNTYNKLKRDLKILKEQHALAQQQYTYNRHLFQELEVAKIAIDEQGLAEQSLEKINNIESIKLNLSQAQELLFQEGIGLLDEVNIITNNLQKIADYSPEYKALYERLLSVKIELSDLAGEIENQNESVEFSQVELDRLNGRLQLMLDLQNKHLVKSNKELLHIQDNLAKTLEEVSNSEAIFKSKETEIQTIAENLNGLALEISTARKGVLPELISKLHDMLSNLGMENTRIRFDFTRSDSFLQNGIDVMDLKLSADKGHSFGPIKKIASGGEASRIMLSIKAIISKYFQLPTIIFDEIDSGVSGDISQKMSDILWEMSRHMQVIAITHVPQIASKGEHHYKVYKKEVNNSIITQLTELSFDDRVAEIAEMLSGKNAGTTAIDHAKQLLS